MYEQSHFIRQYIQDHITTQWNVYWDCVQDIIDASNLIAESFKSGGKLMLCGNGGSAADCQHLAAEFVPMGLPAIALTTDTSFLTAYSNDVSYDWVFAQQVRTLGKDGDVLLGISTSGRSSNVCKAVMAAVYDEPNIKAIVLTGKSGGDMLDAHKLIKVPSEDIQHIQEAHSVICHLIWLLVKENVEL